MSLRQRGRGRAAPASTRRPFERLLTEVEDKEGPRRLFKEGLSILNIPTAIHAWKWRAAIATGRSVVAQAPNPRQPEPRHTTHIKHHPHQPGECLPLLFLPYETQLTNDFAAPV